MKTEEKEIWKKIYRRAIAICHPDRIAVHLRGRMEAITKELNAAWQAEDFVKVRQIAISLGVKDIPTSSANSSFKQRATLKPTIDDFDDAVRSGNIVKVRQCLAAGMSPNAEVEVPFDMSGYFDGGPVGPLPPGPLSRKVKILGVAIECGNLEAVKALVSAGAVLYDNSNLGIIGTSISYGHTEVAKFLISIGANPNPLEEGVGSSLILAASNGNTEIVKSLLSVNSKLNAREYDGKTALMKAAERNHLGIVQILIDAGADPNMATDDGETALLIAKRKRNPAMIRILAKVSSVWTRFKAWS